MNLSQHSSFQGTQLGEGNPKLQALLLGQLISYIQDLDSRKTLNQCLSQARFLSCTPQGPCIFPRLGDSQGYSHAQAPSFSPAL